MTQNETQQPVVVKLENKTLQQEAVDWAKKQGAAAIILLVVLYFLTNWVAEQVKWVKEQVPVHLQSIKEGYKTVAVEYIEARKEADIRHNEALKTVVENCKDSLDRQERILTSKMNEANRKIQELERKTEHTP